MACKAEEFAKLRPCHQEIRRKDIIPTPSQPKNKVNKLPLETSTSIIIKNNNIQI